MSFFGEIYADPDLPHRARTVYMYLRDRAGGGSCWPGVKTIAHDLHLSPRTVQRALERFRTCRLHPAPAPSPRKRKLHVKLIHYKYGQRQIGTRTLPTKGNVRAFAVTSAMTPRRGLKGQL